MVLMTTMWVEVVQCCQTSTLATYASCVVYVHINKLPGHSAKLPGPAWVYNYHNYSHIVLQTYKTCSL